LIDLLRNLKKNETFADKYKFGWCKFRVVTLV
jgi:hypothetical protein